MALSEASKEAMYLKRFVEEIEEGYSRPVKLFNDNAGAQALAANPVFHARTKHIHIRHHFVREASESGEIELSHLPSEDMPADVLTKGLSRIKHWRCLQLLGMNAQNPEERTRFERGC